MGNTVVVVPSRYVVTCRVPPGGGVGGGGVYIYSWVG